MKTSTVYSRCRSARREWRLSALTLCFLASSTIAIAADRRGGIEIGAKGVKFSVVDLDVIKPVDQGDIVTTISSGVATSHLYNADAIRETAEAAGQFAKQITEKYGVPIDKIRIFGSSGLPEATNRQDLVNAVKTATGLPAMEFITPCREVELTIAGLITDPAALQSALLIDVGSGNTKGGILDSGGRPICFSIPQGSVTYADRVTKAAGGNPFLEASKRLSTSLLQAPLTEQVGPNPLFAQKSTVYLNGGAPYVLASMIHPEAALDRKVTLTAKDITDYYARLASDPDIFSPDLSGITDDKVKEAASKEIKSIRDKFKRENLIAGAEILVAISTVFHLEEKTLVFDRTGVTALVRAPFDLITPDPVPVPVPTPTPVPPPAPVEPAKVETKTLEERKKPVYPSPQSPI